MDSNAASNASTVASVWDECRAIVEELLPTFSELMSLKDQDQ